MIQVLVLHEYKCSAKMRIATATATTIGKYSCFHCWSLEVVTISCVRCSIFCGWRLFSHYLTCVTPFLSYFIFIPLFFFNFFFNVFIRFAVLLYNLVLFRYFLSIVSLLHFHSILFFETVFSFSRLSSLSRWLPRLVVSI
jgi:hypothetical protein